MLAPPIHFGSPAAEVIAGCGGLPVPNCCHTITLLWGWISSQAVMQKPERATKRAKIQHFHGRHTTYSVPLSKWMTGDFS
jgi:hypothetical protein